MASGPCICGKCRRQERERITMAIDFSMQSIKRMIRSGYFGDWRKFTEEDIKRAADEAGIPVAGFKEYMREVEIEISQGR